MPYTRLLSLKKSLGFTLIELLIVIAILGILAVAVLAALNPVEQINRGRDTGSLSDAEQLIGAMDRYHAFKGYYPWVVGASATSNNIAWRKVDGTFTVTSLGGCKVLDRLGSITIPSPAGCTNANELKAGFVNRISATDYNSLYIYNRGNRGDSTYVCFESKSQEFATDATERCSGVAGTLPGDYPPEACSTSIKYTCIP